MKPESPYVSTLVVAYKRKEYLLSSIRSALEQKGNHHPFEVVVVKGFHDDKIDEFIRVNGVRSVELGSGEVGTYLAEGVRQCSGEVVAFLDDDDTFHPGKVATLEKFFAANPKLAYFHNEHDVRYDDGRMVKGLLHKSNGTSMTMSGVSNDPSKFRQVILHNLVINLSSISLRRKVLLEGLDQIESMTGTTDYLMLYVALAGGGDLLFNGEVLTTYFIHPSAMRPKGSTDDLARSMASLTDSQIACHEFGASLPSSLGLREATGALKAQGIWMNSLMSNLGRKDLAITYLEYVKRSATFRPRYVSLSIPFGIGGLLSPRICQKLFFAIRTIVED